MGLEGDRYRIVQNYQEQGLTQAILNGHEQRLNKLEKDLATLEATMRMVIKDESSNIR